MQLEERRQQQGPGMYAQESCPHSPYAAHVDPSAEQAAVFYSESNTTTASADKNAAAGDSGCGRGTTMAANSTLSHPEVALLPEPGGPRRHPQSLARTTAATALFCEPPQTPLGPESNLSAPGARLNATPVRLTDEGSSNALMMPVTLGFHGNVPSVAPVFLSPPGAPGTPANQRMQPTAFASPISTNAPAPSTRRKTATPSSSRSGGGGPAVPSFCGVGVAESPLMTVPSAATTLAKQRRTIHSVPGSSNGVGGANGNGVGFISGGNVVLTPAAGAADSSALGASTAGPNGPRTTATATRNNATLHVTTTTATMGRCGTNGSGPQSPSSGVSASPLTTSPAIGAVTGRIPTQNATKYHRGEASLKRSAEVISQFSALDLEGSVSSPSQQSYANHGLGNGLNTPLASFTSMLFPSQPSQQPQGQRQGQQQQGQPSGGFVPMTPTLLTRGPSGGYATPTALSQPVDFTRLGGSLSHVFMRHSQDFGAGGDCSQAETEYSNIFSKRILNEFREIQELGQGAFGKVALYEEACSGQLVAVKVSAPMHTSADAARIFRRERAVMQFLNGRTNHIVRLLNTWEEGRGPQVYLQLEYCAGGSVASLAERKRNLGERWEEGDVLVFLLHMAIALDAMHSANIAHVDFKPDNVLIDANGNYKLSDFGCSVVLNAEGRACGDVVRALSRGLATSGEGVPTYSPPLAGHEPEDVDGADVNNRMGGATAANAAPHVQPFDATQLSVMSVDEGDCRYLCSDMLNGKRYVKAGDMFSFGMSLFELMSGAPLPRGGDAFQQLRRRAPVQRLLERGYSQPLLRLVEALLAEDPTARPTAREVLQHIRPPMELLQGLASETIVREWTTLASTEKRPQSGAMKDAAAAPRSQEGHADETEEEGGCAEQQKDGGEPREERRVQLVEDASNEETLESSPRGDATATNATTTDGARMTSSPLSPQQDNAMELFKMRRVLAATLEATHWLLESAQREFMVANGLVNVGINSNRRDLEKTAALVPNGFNERSCGVGGGASTDGMGLVLGRGNNYAFSPPSCVTPVNVGSPPPLNPSELFVAGTGSSSTFATPMRKGPPPCRAFPSSGHGGSRTQHVVGKAETEVLDGISHLARQRQGTSDPTVRNIQQQRDDASTPTVLPGAFNWRSL